jgi:MtN3 and saliva related transmembrane protein
MDTVLSSLAPQDVANVTGFMAAILTTTAFAPQVVLAWRTGARDLSWAMLALFGTGVGLWLIYGIAVGSWPVITGNALTCIQILLIAVLKAWPRSGAPAGAQTSPESSGY